MYNNKFIFPTSAAAAREMSMSKRTACLWHFLKWRQEQPVTSVS